VANPAPRVIVRGEVRRAERVSLAATDRLPAREIARVQLLTEGGGFTEVTFASDKLDLAPGEGEIGFDVSLVCDVRVWNRTTADGARSYGTLLFYVVEHEGRPAKAGDAPRPVHAVS
jgi:hypothetical protein